MLRICGSLPLNSGSLLPSMPESEISYDTISTPYNPVEAEVSCLLSAYYVTPQVLNKSMLFTNKRELVAPSFLVILLLH